MARKRGTLTNIGRALGGATNAMDRVGSAAVRRAKEKVNVQERGLELRKQAAETGVAETKAADFHSPEAIKSRAIERGTAGTNILLDTAKRAQDVKTTGQAAAQADRLANQNLAKGALELNRMTDPDSPENQTRKALAMKATREAAVAGQASGSTRNPSAGMLQGRQFQDTMARIGMSPFMGQRWVQGAFAAGASDTAALGLAVTEKAIDYAKSVWETIDPPPGSTPEAMGILMATIAMDEHAGKTLEEADVMSTAEAWTAVLIPTMGGLEASQATTEGMAHLLRGLFNWFGGDVETATARKGAKAAAFTTEYPAGARSSKQKREEHNATEALDSGDMDSLVNSLEVVGGL